MGVSALNAAAVINQKGMGDRWMGPGCEVWVGPDGYPASPAVSCSPGTLRSGVVAVKPEVTSGDPERGLERKQPGKAGNALHCLTEHTPAPPQAEISNTRSPGVDSGQSSRYNNTQDCTAGIDSPPVD